MRTMKALKTFRVSDTGKVARTGQEFETTLGDAYEKRSYAVFTDTVRKDAAPRENKAAETGPLASHGGQTGEASNASSSQAAPAQRKPRSKRSKAGQKS